MKLKCPVCSATELIHDTRDLSYTYKGESGMPHAYPRSKTTGYFSVKTAHFAECKNN